MTAEQYLEEHGLSPEFVKKLGWVWDDERIVIPYYDVDRNLLHCRYRNLNRKPKFDADPDSSLALYAVHKIKNNQVVIFCEGEPDCAKLWQEGIPAVTSGGVSSLNSKIAQSLADKEIILLMDNDKAGQDVIEKYSLILEEIGASVQIATLPEGIKDVCEYFIKSGDKEDFQEIMQSAISFVDWQEAHEPEKFTIISGEDILKLELPEQEWLIDKMVPTEGFTFIIGNEGTGKSFNSLTMANAIATGTPWLDTFIVKKKSRVLFIDKESTIRRLQSRMKGLQMTGKNMYFLASPQWFSLAPDRDGEIFSDFALKIQRFVEKHDIGLLIIDSFADVMLGNENSAADTQMFFDGFRQLVPGRALIVLHHANKPSAGVIRTASQKTRGSTNIMAQTYSAFFVEQIPKRDKEFSFEHIKAGDTEKLKKFKIEMEVHTSPYGDHKTTVTGLKYKGEIEDEEGKEMRAEDSILLQLQVKGEVQRKELEDVCIAQGLSKATFKKALDKLREEKIIDTTPDPTNKQRSLISLI